MIDKNEIETLKNSVDIVNIISQFVKLERHGNSYMAKCPFGHSDSNPSFSVSRDLQIFQCFSCHKKGNVFNFFMELERLSYKEAIQKVASLTGFKLNANLKLNVKKDSILYDIYNDTQKIYFNNLKTAEGRDAKEYLLNRNIKDDLIDTFQIGYASHDRNLLTKLFLNKYKEVDLINSGLISKNDNMIYDSYYDRIMFPIHNLDGKIVGYSGRIYRKDDNAPKYINTKQTDIFKKGELIYNYHRALPYCRKTNKVIIMEGFMDVINAYRNGIYNVIAMMGTAFTKYQALNIKKLADDIILCFDGDSAGFHATYSCTNELLKYNVTPKIVILEDKLDPDEYINKYGIDKFMDKLDNTINVMDFKLKYFKLDKDFNSIDDRKKYVTEVLNELKLTNDQILIDLTIDKLNEETGISKQLMLSKITTEVKKEEEIPKDTKLENYVEAERNLVYYMLHNDELINIYNKNNIYMTTLKYRSLARFLSNYYKEYRKIDIEDIKEKATIDNIDTIYELQRLDLKKNYTNDEINDYIKVILEYNISCEIKRLQNEIQQELDLTKKIKMAEEIRKLKMKGDKYD